MANLDKHRTPEQEVITSRQPIAKSSRQLSLGLATYFRAAGDRLNHLEYGDPAEYLVRAKGVEVPNSPLNTIWVPPRFKRQDEAGEDVVLNTLLLDTNPCILVLADPGCGKSTLARFLTCFFIERFCNAEAEYFGLLVPLNNLRTSGMTYQEAVVHCAAKYVGLEHEATVVEDLRKHLADACVIFDGLDELPVSRRVSADGETLPLRREAAALVRALRYVQASNGEEKLPNKSIVTCRSRDYFDDRESNLGALPYYYLAHFSPDQMNAAVRQWHDAAKARSQEHLRGDTKILRVLDERYLAILGALRGNFELASVCLTPLMLNILQTVYSDANDLPSSVSQLCWRAVNWFLIDKHLVTSQKQFVVENGSWLLQAITDLGWLAHNRVVEGKAKVFSDSELREVTKRACTVKKLLRSDYETQEDAITRVTSFLRRGHGILVSVSLDEFDFVHNVFREVMAGRALSKLSVPDRRVLALNELWHGPIRYWAGLRAVDADGLYEISAFVGELFTDVQSGSVTASLARAEMLVEVCSIVPVSKFTHDLKRQIETVRDELCRLLGRTELHLNHRIRLGDLLGVLGDPRLEKGILERVQWVKAGQREIGRSANHRTRVAKYQSCPAAPPISGYLNQFAMGSFLVTNREYNGFVIAGGYKNQRYWPCELAWSWAQREGATTRSLVEKARTVAATHFSSELAGQRLVPDEIPERCMQMINRDLPMYWIDPSFNRPNQPVVGVNWWEACAYCMWLEDILRGTGAIDENMRVRLPIEAEWETMARLAGDGAKYPWIDGTPADSAHVRAAFSNGDTAPVFRSCAVGLFQSVKCELSVFDLVGNVWEWTASRAGVYSSHSFDQEIDFEGLDDRISRGSSWLSSEEESTEITFRSFDPPYNAYEDLGFRIALYQMK